LVRGLYAAGLGMTTQLKKMDIVSHNIANVGTAGYKKDSVATQSFAEELMKRLHDPGLQIFGHAVNIGRITSGVFVDTVFTNYSSGSIVKTDNVLDLSIAGDGFFAVDVAGPGGRTAEKYTRDGQFTLADGRLLTRDGAAVLGVTGPVTVPEGDIVIDPAGNIFVNGDYINSLRMVDFEDRSTLRSVKDNMFETTADSVFKPATGLVEQGSIESSNVNSAREMIEMITVNRVYEANQRSIVTIDNTLNKAVNEIANKVR